MKLSVFVILSLFLVGSEPFELVGEIDGDYLAVEVDELGGAYLGNTQKHLVKLDQSFQPQYTYESKNIEVDFFGVQNALRILVFNSELNSVVFLDKTLSEASEELSLDAVNLPLVKAIGISRDNNVWVFDDNLQELKKYDSKFQEISNSGNIINLAGDSWFPYLLKEQNGNVYVADSTKGIMEFDFLGSYLRTLPFKITGDFKVIENQMLYIENDSLIVRDMLLGDQKKLGLPVRGITDFAYSKDRIFLISSKKLHIYRLPL